MHLGNRKKKQTKRLSLDVRCLQLDDDDDAHVYDSCSVTRWMNQTEEKYLGRVKNGKAKLCLVGCSKTCKEDMMKNQKSFFILFRMGEWIYFLCSLKLESLNGDPILWLPNFMQFLCNGAVKTWLCNYLCMY